MTAEMVSEELTAEQEQQLAAQEQSRAELLAAQEQLLAAESGYRGRLNLDWSLPLNVDDRELMGPRPFELTYEGWCAYYEARPGDIEDAIHR